MLIVSCGNILMIVCQFSSAVKLEKSFRSSKLGDLRTGSNACSLFFYKDLVYAKRAYIELWMHVIGWRAIEKRTSHSSRSILCT